MIEVENVTCSIVTQSLSSKSTATVEEMLTILQTSGSNILVKLDGLYELTQDSFRLSNESPYLFEWNTSYNITSGKSVSICTPLARFLARLVNTAAACSLPFSLSALQPLSNAQMRGLCIACEYAIRNFSFASQVEIDLWKRNGLDVVNLIYNYNRASASKFFRDLDLIVVQLGVALIGPDSVLKNMFAAFECSLVESVRVRKLKYSTRAQMFAEMLRWLILIVTYLPHDLSKSAAEVAMEESKMDSPLSQTREGLEMSVDRVVAHLLLSGKNSKGKLQSVKSLLRLDTEIGDDEINASTARLCQIKSKSKEPALLEPKYPEVLMLFDPEHPYLAAKELQSANESARSYRNKPEVLTILLSKCIQRPLMKVPVLPVILPCGLPIPHPEFQIVRNLLFSTEFFQLMITALSLPSETEIVNLTLTKDENKIPKSTIVSILSRCIHLLTIQIHSLPPTEVFEKFSEEWNRIWSLLASVHRLRLLDEDQLYLQGLEWLLREYCWRSETARRCLLQLNYEGAVEIEELLTDRNKKESAKTNDAEEPKDPSMERRKLQARQKAMAAMQKNVSSFTAQMGGETFAEDNNDELQCGPECIICREMNEKPTGYLIHVQPSQVLTRAISQSLTNYTHRYLVVRPTPVYGSPTDLSAPIKPGPKFILQAGEVIYSRERSLLTWIRMASPEENWVEIYRTVANESDSKKQEQCVQLIPLELISHSRHGAVRPFGKFQFFLVSYLSYVTSLSLDLRPWPPS